MAEYREGEWWIKDPPPEVQESQEREGMSLWQRVGSILLFALLLSAGLEAIRIDGTSYSFVNVLWRTLWTAIILCAIDFGTSAFRRRRTG